MQAVPLWKADLPCKLIRWLFVRGRGLVDLPLALMLEVADQRLPRLSAIGVVRQVRFLVLHVPLQAYDEHDVHRSAATLHRDRQAALLQPAREGSGREVRSLIAVDYPSPLRGQRFVEPLAEASFQLVRQPSRQNAMDRKLADWA